MSELSPLRDLNTTASQAPVIVNGTPTQLLELWQERIGDKPPRDLTDNLPVYLGKILEQPMLNWMQRRSGHEISERQRFIAHPSLPNISATLDGYRAFDDAIIEFKVPGPFRQRSEILTWYAPQLVVQQACRQCEHAVLAILQGHESIIEIELVRNEDYEAQVWERIAAFQLCVETMSPPAPLPVLVAPEQWRTVDLANAIPMPNWGGPMIAQMRLWSETREYAKAHERTKADIKAMLPDDVGLVTYGDMSVRRSKNRAVTIREKELFA